jgi:hypothetical protein
MSSLLSRHRIRSPFPSTTQYAQIFPVHGIYIVLDVTHRVELLVSMASDWKVYEKADGDESTRWNSSVYIEERDFGYMLEGSLALVRGINLRSASRCCRAFLSVDC